MERPFEAMSELIDDGYPVFLTGDFNQPSSLDYTEETVGTRKEITEPVPWPVSEELFDLGFRDTYREVHPDPVEDPASPTAVRRADRLRLRGGPVDHARQQARRRARRRGRRDRGGAVDLRPLARCCRASR